MRKYLFVTIFIFTGQLPALCQTFTEVRRSDSLRLDSIKRMMPLLKDSAKVDALNTISSAFGYFSPSGGFRHKVDSMLAYASRAYEEAKKIGYKHGMATALLMLSAGEVSQNLTPKDKPEKEKNISEALRLGEEINNHSVIGRAFYALAMFPTINKDVRLTEEYFHKAIFHLKKAGDVLPLAEILNWLTAGYLSKNEYLKAFEFADQSVRYSKEVNWLIHDWKTFLVQYSLSNMAELYKAVGDYQTALDYLKQANQYGIVHQSSWIVNDEIGGLFNLIGQKDSARYYFQKSLIIKTPSNPYASISLGRTYLALEDYSKSLPLLQQGVDNLKKKTESAGFGSVLLDLSKAYFGKKNYTAALKYAKEGLAWAQKNKDAAPQLLLTAYELLSDIYHRLNKNDLAFNSLKKYNVLKDSLQQRQRFWRLNIELYKYKQASIEAKKETRIGFLQRDNKIKQQQLQQEVFIRNSLIGGLVLLFFIGVAAFRNLRYKRKNERLRLQKDMELQKLQSEQKQTELQRQAVELEMQALRAQMNPHFIFNCLSSINRFIFKNDNKEASDYLTKFSRLIRMVLIQSQKKLIPLEDELEMLRLYLDMERMRFKNGFDYSITTNNTIDAGAIFIPPLLLQPFCENAIWHGLMHKDGQGHLNISITEENLFLICTITDDGIGRKKAESYKSKSAEKEKSLGLKITANRLALLNKEQNIGTSYEIEDILNEEGNVAGTKVQLKIFYKEAFEEIEQNA
jgi:hypothetical protein